MFRLFKFRYNEASGDGDWEFYPTDCAWPDKDVIEYLKDEGDLFKDHKCYRGREVVRVHDKRKIASAKADYRNMIVKEIETLFVRFRNLR